MLLRPPQRGKAAGESKSSSASPEEELPCDASRRGRGSDRARLPTRRRWTPAWMGGREACHVGDPARRRVHADPAARGRPRGGGTETERRVDDERRPRRRGAGEGSRGPGGDPEAERRGAARIRRWARVREPGGPAAAWGISRVRRQSKETGEEPRNRAHRDRAADGEGVLLARPL